MPSPPIPLFDPSLDLSWFQQAACRGADPDIFFPQRGENRALLRAKQICQTCPVSPQCLDYALTTHAHHGIYGGLSERQRRTIRSSRLRQARLQERTPTQP